MVIILLGSYRALIQGLILTSSSSDNRPFSFKKILTYIFCVTFQTLDYVEIVEIFAMRMPHARTQRVCAMQVIRGTESSARVSRVSTCFILHIYLNHLQDIFALSQRIFASMAYCNSVTIALMGWQRGKRAL